MKKLVPLISSGMRNNLRMKAVTVGFIALTVLLAAGVTALFSIGLIKPALAHPLPETAELELYLGLIMYSASLMGLGINLNVYASHTMTREKARGSIEALLATPLKAKEIWLAKSLAVFIPGLILGTALALAVMFAINYIYFVPRIGFLVNPWIAVNSFVAAPLVYLFLTLLVHLVGLTGKTANGNIIAQVFLPVFINLMVNLAAHNVIDAASWPFTAVNLAAAAVTGAIVLLLRPRLTAERIVLSR